MKLKNVILSLLFICSYLQVKADYRILTFCREVRNITLSVTNSGTIPVASWNWTYANAVEFPTNFRKDSVLGPISYDQQGTFFVYVTTTFTNGQADKDTWELRAFTSTIPSFDFPDSASCANTVNLNYSTSFNNPQYRYLWKPNNSTSKNLNITQPGSYTGIVYSIDDYSDRFGACDSQFQTFTITKSTPAVVSLPQGLFVCGGNTLILDANNPGNEYSWLPNGEETQFISVELPGIYEVTVTTPDGCVSTASTKVLDSCPIYVWMPNAFSPNGDGRNDSLLWKGNVFFTEDYEFKIYNRWGEKVFETYNFKQAWDGLFNKKEAQAGVYIYMLSFTDARKELKKLKGNITLVR